MYYIIHLLKREARSAPRSWPSLAERWQLSQALLSSLPSMEDFIAVKEHRERRELSVLGGCVVRVSRTGISLPSLLGRGACFLSLRPSEEGRVPEAPLMKIWGACRKGQMAFHFLEGCSLLMCPRLCAGEQEEVSWRTVCIHAWWAKMSRFL